MNDSECQKDELCALESIYTSEELMLMHENGLPGGQFHAYVDTKPNYQVIYKDLGEEECSSYQKIAIDYLPPVTLYFILPGDYPSKSPPSFTISCKWLGKINIAKLCKKLDSIWMENIGMEILFLWTQFLKDDLLNFLGFSDHLDVSSLYTFHLRFSEKLKRRQVRLENPKKNIKNSVPSQQMKALQKHCPKISHIKRCIQKSVVCVEKSNTQDITEENEAGAVEYRHGVTDNPSKFVSISEENDNGPGVSLKSNTKCVNKGKRIRSIPYDPRGVLDLDPQTSVINFLKDFNQTREQVMFKRNFYMCKICFQEKQGTICTRFDPCKHVFCRECISGYFEVKIKDGAVQNIKCPEEECGSEATPSQVKDLVPPALFLKYDSVLLNAMLDTLSDVMYCPRSACQYPVTKEPDEKMATCPLCHYAFCVYCKMVYHGIEPCRFKTEEKKALAQEYLNCSSERKLELEQRYGKKQLQVLIDTILSEQWINKNSKNCPHCNASIEKSDGCNKMECSKCHTYFCWICNARLNPQSPYLHFSSPGSKCFNKLFPERQNIDDEDDFLPEDDQYEDYNEDQPWYEDERDAYD